MHKQLKQLDIDELYRLSDQIEKDADRVASMLFPDNPLGGGTLTRQIGQWAINQTVVLESNQNNKVDLAIIFNKVSERIWNQLPSCAKQVKINVRRHQLLD